MERKQHTLREREVLKNRRDLAVDGFQRVALIVCVAFNAAVPRAVLTLVHDAGQGRG